MRLIHLKIHLFEATQNVVLEVIFFTPLHSFSTIVRLGGDFEDGFLLYQLEYCVTDTQNLPCDIYEGVRQLNNIFESFFRDIYKAFFCYGRPCRLYVQSAQTKLECSYNIPVLSFTNISCRGKMFAFEPSCYVLRTFSPALK